MKKSYYHKKKREEDIHLWDVLLELIGFVFILHAMAFIFMTIGIISGNIRAGDTSMLSEYYRWFINLILK